MDGLEKENSLKILESTKNIPASSWNIGYDAYYISSWCCFIQCSV